MSTRITALGEISSIQNGDFIVIDNATNGTHKYDATKLSANIASNIASAYSSSATYAIGQYCMYNNNLYRCITTISTAEAWNAAHWTQVTVGDSLYSKVDKVSGKGLSANDFTNTLKNKLDGIANGAEVNVQADWSVSDTNSDAFIKNKPGDATTTNSGFMSASDKQKLNGIETGAEVNVQANWTENDSSKDAYILNKPTSDATLAVSGGFADGQTVGLDFATSYSSSATYDEGDCVLYDGRVYVCNTAITTAEAWTAAHWTQTSVGAIFEAIVSGTEANALYHLGFYLDENGDLNQIDDEE